MTCNRCGGLLPAGSTLCPACGAPVGGPAASIGFSAPPIGPTSSSVKAIVSFVFGLLALFTPAAIVAVILGHLSLSEIKKSGGRLSGRGLAIAGLVLGYLGTALGVLLVPIIIVGIIRMGREVGEEGINSNELTASNSVKYVVQAERSYIATHPGKEYPCDFQTLIDANLLEPEVVRSAYHGYAIALEGCTHGGDGRAPGNFVVIARPVQPGQTGNVDLCSDESGKVKYIRTGAGNCMQSELLWDHSD